MQENLLPGTGPMEGSSNLVLLPRGILEETHSTKTLDLVWPNEFLYNVKRDLQDEGANHESDGKRAKIEG